MIISTKQELLKHAQQSFDDLISIINKIPIRKRNFTVDVLMHLYEWHAMLERWYREGRDGDTPAMPAAG